MTGRPVRLTFKEGLIIDIGPNGEKFIKDESWLNLTDLTQALGSILGKTESTEGKIQKYLIEIFNDHWRFGSLRANNQGRITREEVMADYLTWCQQRRLIPELKEVYGDIDFARDRISQILRIEEEQEQVMPE